MTPPPEPTGPAAAIAAYLKEECSQAEGRVFRPELPRGEASKMPRAAIVIFSGGGGHMFGADRLPAFDSVYDIACYGATRLQAEQLGEEAQSVLRELAHVERKGTLLHWARIVGALKSAVDTDTSWPFGIVTIQVMHTP